MLGAFFWTAAALPYDLEDTDLGNSSLSAIDLGSLSTLNASAPLFPITVPVKGTPVIVYIRPGRRLIRNGFAVRTLLDTTAFAVRLSAQRYGLDAKLTGEYNPFTEDEGRGVILHARPLIESFLTWRILENTVKGLQIYDGNRPRLFEFQFRIDNYDKFVGTGEVALDEDFVTSS
ncbi:MAG: hypothetical protein LQ351_007686 [Letrouitia transgressa]|nr:MAG: hypothetical protein LQ351_007686 [Letrouitia transgressa]